MSPSAKILKRLRDQGAKVVKLEHWNHHARVTQDIWGADLLALQGIKLIAIQCTSSPHHASRVKKSKANEDVANWLAGGVAFEVWSVNKDDDVRVTQLTLNGNDEVVEA